MKSNIVNNISRIAIAMIFAMNMIGIVNAEVFGNSGDIPIIGDWNGDGIDEIAVFRQYDVNHQNNAVFYLKTGTQILELVYGNNGDTPIVGDWNGDGKDTIGVYRPSEAKFYLDNNNDGITDSIIPFGLVGDFPIVGDWNSDGKDEIGVFRQYDINHQNNAVFYLKNGDQTSVYVYGNNGDTPIIGDWNGDGIDEIGVFRQYDPDYQDNAVFYPIHMSQIVYGNNGDIPIVGKPEADRLTRIGVYRPSTQEFIFKSEPITPTPTPTATPTPTPIPTFTPTPTPTATPTPTPIPTFTPTPTPTATPITPPKTLTVCPGGCAYSSIQTAINAANSGDTVIVNSGTYYENVKITKSLVIKSMDGASSTIIQAANLNDNVFYVKADYVNITGFTIRGATGSGSYSGVRFYSSKFSNIFSNIIYSNNWGITIGPYVSNNSIFNNFINGDGTIGNTQHGIEIFGTQSQFNAILNNSINSILIDGIRLDGYTKNNLISNNIVNSSGHGGIGIFDSNENIIKNNRITNNGYYGFFSRDPCCGLESDNSINNKIYHNDFINNYKQANETLGTNSWDNGYPDGGNYWSDYTGIDLKSGPNQDQPGSDNIGDTSYPIPVNSIDRYPSMIPYSAIPTIIVTSPNGGENWQVGSTQTIKWSYTGNPGDNVKIELLKGGIVDQTITSSTPINSGSYDWTFPSIAGTDYQIRIISTTNNAYNDTSDGNFVISSAEITVGQGAPNDDIKNAFIDAYNRNGGTNKLGDPTTNVHSEFGYYIQEFPGVTGIPGGIIMYNPNINVAYYIHGAIYQKYKYYPNKERLGSLKGDEKDAGRSPQGTTGKYSEFETGRIHWISDKNVDNKDHLQRGKSFITYDGLDTKYTELGGTNSRLGFPLIDQPENTQDFDTSMKFEGGEIIGSGDWYNSLYYEPDLIIAEPIKFSIDNPIEGQPVEITATIKNIGKGIAKGNIRVIFSQVSDYIIENSDRTGSELIFNYKDEGTTLKTGESFDVKTIWNVAPIYSQQGRIRVLLEYKDEIDTIHEEYESNNDKYGGSEVIITSRSNYKPEKDGYHFVNEPLTDAEKEKVKENMDNLLKNYKIYSYLTSYIGEVMKEDESGVCFGMSSTSILYNLNIIPKPINKDVFLMDKDNSDVWNKIIEYQLYDYIWIVPDTIQVLKENIPFTGISAVDGYDTISNSIKYTHKPIVLGIKLPKGYHAVVPFNIYSVSDKIKNVLVYDPNYPGMARVIQFDLENNKIIDKEYNSAARELDENKYFDTTIVNSNILDYMYIAIQELHRMMVRALLTTTSKLFTFESPVNVTMTDQYGRIINDNGINNIPNAKFMTFGHIKMFQVPQDLDYVVKVNAYDSGNVTIRQISPLTSDYASITSFEDIPITKNTNIIIDASSQNSIYIANIDYNGDGIIDKIKMPDIVGDNFYNITFLPPIKTMEQFNLTNGSTLPIKFVTRNSTTNEFIYDDTVNVTITDSTGRLITHFINGTGTNNVWINSTEEQYIANFHTKYYGLKVRETYTITVTFGKSDDLKGYTVAHFTVVDNTPPQITINVPIDDWKYILNQNILADWSVIDLESGIASKTGTKQNGEAIDTATVETKTFTVDAADNAGNSATKTVSYNIVYNFAGFFQPIDNLPTLNAVKAGSAIPVKFSLKGDQKLDIFATGYPASQKITCDSNTPVDDIEETITAGSSSISYDASIDQYKYVWKTNNAWAGTCRNLAVKLKDGTYHNASFKFK